MGRSMFGYGRFVVCTARYNLEMVELDMSAAFLQLRYWHAPEDRRARMNNTKFLLDQENITDFLETASNGNVKLAKKMLKIFTNCGDDSAYLQLPAPLQELLVGIRDEMQSIIQLNVNAHPDLVGHFAHRRHPRLSAHAPIDEHREGEAIDKVIRAVSNDSDDRFRSFIGRAHDGIDIPRLHRSNEALIGYATEATGGLLFSVKPYSHPLTIASDKWPNEDWSQISKVSVQQHLDDLKVLRNIVMNSRPYSAYSLVFKRLVEASMRGCLLRNGSVVEHWDGHRWSSLDDLNSITEEIVQMLVAQPHRLADDSVDIKYALNVNIPPATDADFVKKVSKLLHEFLPRGRDTTPLDGSSEGLLLFKNNMVVNYPGNEVVKNDKDFRLFRSCAVDLEDWNVSDELKNKVDDLSIRVHKFFKDGGACIADGEGAAAEIRQIVDDLVPLCPTLKQIWTTFEDYDDLICWLRIEERILSGHLGYAEAYVLSGPHDCGKSKLGTFVF
jgi:hypothetical protein